MAETSVARTCLQEPNHAHSLNINAEHYFLDVARQGAVGFRGGGPEDTLLAGVR